MIATVRRLFTILIALSLVTVLVLTPVNVSAKGESYSVYIQGFAVDSYDGNATWTDGTDYYGNITAIEIDDTGASENGADDAVNTQFGQGGEIKDDFSWDATPSTGKERHEWATVPETKGENVMYLAQFYDERSQRNYTWISNWHANGYETPLNIEEHHVRYEPIPGPRLNPYAKDAVGSTWMNISIPHFKYTDYNASTGRPNRMGTYDLFQSYAVFVKEYESKKWQYLGNSKQDPNALPENKPIPAYGDQTDPNKIDTGSDYFLADGLEPGKKYSFLVRVNFVTRDNNELGPVWGYSGGLGDKTTSSGNTNTPSPTASKGAAGGSITTFASGRGGWKITDDDSTPPTVDITSPAHDSDIGSSSVTIQWSGSDGESGIDYYEIRRDGGSWNNVGTSTSYTYSSLADGTHTVDVRAHDNAGNVETDWVRFQIDTTDPTVSIDSPSGGSIVEDNDITIEWSGSDATTGIDYYYIRKDSGIWDHMGASTSHTYTDVTRDTHTIDVEAVDNVGNSAVDTVSFQVDPTVTLSLSSSSSSQSDWNFVSSALISDEKNLVSILEDPDDGISGSYSKVMYYNSTLDEWKTYIPGRDALYNDDIQWDRSKGLWIMMTADDTLAINGTEPVKTNITLNPGWNMVGYPSEVSRTAGDTLPAAVTKIAVFNGTHEYDLEYIYDLNSYILKAKEGYWIYNDQASPVIWTVWYE